MAVPDFQSIMLPLLQLISDGKEHNMFEVIDELGIRLELTPEERNQLYPSGKKQPIFADRIAWARTYLKQAGLLQDTRRSHFRITSRGQELLAEHLPRITMRLLEKYPEYLEFKNRTRGKASQKGSNESSEPDSTTLQTPKEAIERNFASLRSSLAQELLTTIKQHTPAFFERLVVELLVRMGYGGSIQDAGQAIGRTGDEGIDGIIKEDKLGLDVIYVQAKRWNQKVGRPEIHQFAGALAGQRARKGVFISTSSFTNDARDYVDKTDSKIVLIDGEQLAELMIEHNVGVVVDTTYEIKRLDTDYFLSD
jgi:restriction system protein